MTSPLNEPLRLPCGVVVPNRLGQSAMTEGLADELSRATERHVRLHQRWAQPGGVGLMLTGNIQVDRRYLERPGNVAIEGPQDEEQRRRLAAFASAAKANGALVFAQLGHAGRQATIKVTTEPVGPSAQGMRGLAKALKIAGEPRALTAEEIADVTARLVNAAREAKLAGFSGVQLHAAHGYLLSSFLNPAANTRTDQWGGSLENRARLLLDTVRAVREAVGADYPVSVKLNSSDFQKGGLSHEDSVQVARWLDEAGVDLIELSGGNYEAPVLLAGPENQAKDGSAPAENLDKGRREAYFLHYAAAVRKVLPRAKLMVTGGFRTRAAMESALRNGDLDIVGAARPFCGAPDSGRQLLAGEIDALPAFEKTLQAGPAALSKLWRLQRPLPFWKFRMFALQAYYYKCILLMAEGKEPQPTKGPFALLAEVEGYDIADAKALKGINTHGAVYNPKPKPSSTGRTLLLTAGAVGVAGAAYYLKTH